MSFSVYHRHGYIAIVDQLAKQSMQGAVDEVRALPNYDITGEVCVLISFIMSFTCNSGSSPTLGTIQLPTHTTLQCHV